jgi:cell division protein FtsB
MKLFRGKEHESTITRKELQQVKDRTRFLEKRVKRLEDQVNTMLGDTAQVIERRYGS